MAIPNQGTRRFAVHAQSRSSSHGIVMLGACGLRCALGRAGARVRKREGDGATPVGVWTARQVYYRADRVLRPLTPLPIRRLRPDDGWCDEPNDHRYNRLVRHPYLASAERLWRADNLYNLVLLLDHNERPRKRGRGSAIFVHLARPGFKPTDGCIALSERDLRRLLSILTRRSQILVLGA